ncbi:hypothetical protein ACFOSD_15710 [Salinispirillum marinum]|uniref:Uncharacterized protein n=2 Tax=Saccharospirillaceae TaxID=255527 RepID=A0ABV8BHC1_9GAMM
MKINFIRLINLALIILFLSGCGKGDIPTDQEIISSFYENRMSYQSVAESFIANGLHRFEVMSDGTLNIRPDVEIDRVSMKEEILDDIGTNLVSVQFERSTYDTISQVIFFNYRRGIVSSGEHKGVIFMLKEDSEIELHNQLDNIDKSNKEIHGKRLYKYIEPGWYIFYEYLP